MRITLAMQELWLGGTITPAGARLAVRHVFQSGENSPLEVVYAFVLPRDAALCRFTISGEDFEMQSELLPTAAAREAYEQGLTAGHLSSLTQVYGDGLVNLTVGNIRPGEIIKVLLELVAGVESRDDGFRFRFPFTLAPGYHAQARMSLSVGQGIIELPEEQFGDVMLPPWRADGELHRVGFEVKIRHPAGLAEVSSPSHPLRVGMGQDGEARVELAVSSDSPDRDLILDARARETAPCVLSGVDDTGMGRAMVLIPSPAFGTTCDGARRLVFVIDRSGSMEGTPMTQALQAVRACLGTLSKEDAFGIVAFDDSQETFQPQLQPATQDARQAADMFLQKIDARGGTELGSALQKAVNMLQGGGEVLLLTDGQVFGGEHILALVKSSGLRVHCLGIGSASQDRFLTLLARECGGVSRFITARERVDMAALELFNSIGNPVAGDISIRFSAESGAIQPAPPKQVYPGTPLAIFASGNPEQESVLQVEWLADGNRHHLELPVAFTDSDLGKTIKLLQGARIITDLEAHFTAPPAGIIGRRRAKRQQDALLRVSREYGLASQAMSLVAVVQRKGDQPGTVPMTRVVPVGIPDDVNMTAYFSTSSYAPILACPSSDDMLSEAPAPALLRTRRPVAQSKPLPSGFLVNEDEADQSVVEEMTNEDFLVELAGRLLPDGGIPGKNTEQRLLASGLALLAFAEMAHITGTTAFDNHIRRLTSYLQQLDRSGLPLDQQTLLQQVLDLAAKRTSPTCSIALARQHLKKLEFPFITWHTLRELLEKA